MTTPTKPRTKPTKAILGAAIALAGGLATGASDGHLTLAECLLAAVAALVAAGGVYGVTNAPRDDTTP